jgi:hypothetical protein
VVTVAAEDTIVAIEARKIILAHLGAKPEMGGSDGTCVAFLPRSTQLRASANPAVRRNNRNAPCGVRRPASDV